MSYVVEFKGKFYTPDGKVEVENPEEYNKECERKELEWIESKPEKIFAYVKVLEDRFPEDECWYCRAEIGTRMGKVISDPYWTMIGPRRYVGFGGSYRRAVDTRIGGVRYVGWWFESSGDYCRLRKAKRQ